MSLRRILTPSRFLFWCAVVMAFFVVIMIYDSVRDCDLDEFRATKRLLSQYRDQVADLQKERANLKQKLDKTEDQLFKSKSSVTNVVVTGLPMIYLITPTYARMEQKAELTRLSHTFMHVKNIHWIVVEDSVKKTDLVTIFLAQTSLSYTHLSIATPQQYKMKSSDPNWLKPRGVLQRNLGLTWLRENVLPTDQDGVLYFADDDNTYSLKLFEEMRYTKKVSVWPVGLVGYLRYETPIIKDGKVSSWFTYFKPDRPFPMDMAGFAVNLDLLREHKDVSFSNDVQRGYQESHFLTGLNVFWEDLEPKANMCTQILVWHTRTEKANLKNEEKMQKKYGYHSDINIEV